MLPVYLYTIVNRGNGKVYVGKTTDPVRRWSDHKLDSKRRRSRLYSAMRRDGVELFTFTVVACAKTEELAFATERALIRQYDSYRRGYNMTLGGEGPSGAIKPPALIEKLRQRMSGAGNPMFGQTHTPEAMAKIVAHATGRRASDQTKARMSESHKGQSRPKSAEYRRKISEGMSAFYAKRRQECQP